MIVVSSFFPSVAENKNNTQEDEESSHPQDDLVRHVTSPPLKNSKIPRWLYLISTVAPAASSFCFIVSASSLGTPSFTPCGGASTRSLACFNSRVVTSRTALMTSIFLSPKLFRVTVNSVFSSAAGASAGLSGAAGPAPNATGGAHTPQPFLPSM